MTLNMTTLLKKEEAVPKNKRGKPASSTLLQPTSIFPVSPLTHTHSKDPQVLLSQQPWPPALPQCLFTSPVILETESTEEESIPCNLVTWTVSTLSSPAFPSLHTLLWGKPSLPLSAPATPQPPLPPSSSPGPGWALRSGEESGDLRRIAAPHLCLAARPRWDAAILPSSPLHPPLPKFPAAMGLGDC